MNEIKTKTDLTFIKYEDKSLNFKEKDLHPSLFYCPKKNCENVEGNICCLEECDSYAEGEGCKYRSTCGVYQAKKEEELLLPSGELEKENI